MTVTLTLLPSNLYEALLVRKYGQKKIIIETIGTTLTYANTCTCYQLGCISIIPWPASITFVTPCIMLAVYTNTIIFFNVVHTSITMAVAFTT